MCTRRKAMYRHQYQRFTFKIRMNIWKRTYHLWRTYGVPGRYLGGDFWRFFALFVNVVGGWCCTHLFGGADFLHVLFTVYTNWYIHTAPISPAHTPTHCNEMLVVGGVVRIYLDHGVHDFFVTCYSLHTNWYIYCTPRFPCASAHPPWHKSFCADAHGLSCRCCWWVLLLYTPSNNPLTYQPIPTQSRFKVSSLTRIA